MENSSFQQYGKYYDLLYNDKNYAQESSFVLEKLRQFTPNISTLLELGTGTGNYAYFLSAQLSRVVGIEKSPDMLAIAAQKKIPNFTPFLGDITEFSLSEKFDAAVALFHVISYLTNTSDLICCFRCVYNHLREGGLFLFDVWYTPCVLTEKPSVRIKKAEDEQMKVIRIAEPEMLWNESVVNVHFEITAVNKSDNQIFIFSEKHPMRYFTKTEIELLALCSGFEVLCASEFLTDAPLSQHTWGACFVLRKS